MRALFAARSNLLARGRPDGVFRKLANQFNVLAAGPKIRVALTPEEIISQAVWVIENDNAEQGTAFFLKDYGLVTCDHCLGPELKILLPSDPTKQFPVTVVKSDPHIDLAILSIPTALSNIIPLSAYKGPALPTGTPLSLYGYPGHHAAKPIRIEKGSLIRSFPRSAVSYLEITPKIIGGNSGGPVLNDAHEVIGVAVMGLNGKVELKSTEFLAVSVAELAKL